MVFAVLLSFCRPIFLKLFFEWNRTKTTSQRCLFCLQDLWPGTAGCATVYGADSAVGGTQKISKSFQFDPSFWSEASCHSPKQFSLQFLNFCAFRHCSLERLIWPISSNRPAWPAIRWNLREFASIERGATMWPRGLRSCFNWWRRGEDPEVDHTSPLVSTDLSCLNYETETVRYLAISLVKNLSLSRIFNFGRYALSCLICPELVTRN